MPILQPRIDKERGYTEADMQIGADVDKSLSTLIGAPDKFIDSGIQEIYKNASRNGYFNEQFTIDDVRNRYDELVNQQREPKAIGGEQRKLLREDSILKNLKRELRKITRKYLPTEEEKTKLEEINQQILQRQEELFSDKIEPVRGIVEDKPVSDTRSDVVLRPTKSTIKSPEEKALLEEITVSAQPRLPSLEEITVSAEKKPISQKEPEFNILTKLGPNQLKSLRKRIKRMQDYPDAYVGNPDYAIQNLPDRLVNNYRDELLALVDYYRQNFQEGGEAVEDQMNDLMMMPEEEMVPDEEMEDNYIDFIIGESLSMDDEEYLMATLNEDERLSMIFDQVIETASEFSGSGPVEGPGTGISDSIPARLSDGEFVITAKATEEIGPDELQRMMEQAEMNADARQMRQVGGYIQEEEEDQSIQAVKTAARPKQTGQGLLPESLEDRENKKNMMLLNPRNTLLARRP